MGLWGYCYPQSRKDPFFQPRLWILEGKEKQESLAGKPDGKAREMMNGID